MRPQFSFKNESQGQKLFKMFVFHSSISRVLKESPTVSEDITIRVIHNFRGIEILIAVVVYTQILKLTNQSDSSWSNEQQQKLADG